MKSSLIRASVITLSFAAVGLLSLSPSRAADATPEPQSGAAPAGGCCNITVPPPPPLPGANKISCGEGTTLKGNVCEALPATTAAPDSAPKKK